jgi:hypothetical protein
MARFAWAYVDCSAIAGSGSHGPANSLQFVTESGGATTGSAYLRYFTSSVQSYDPNTMVLSGNLIVTGAVSASVFTVQNIIHIDATGSTYFGNTNDDEHVRTGSFIVNPAGASDGTNYTLSASVLEGRVAVRSFKGRYNKVTSTSNYYIDTQQYIVAGSASANQTFYLPTASVVGAGSILIIKDQYKHRASTGITIYASQHGHQTVEDVNSYVLSGAMPSVTLYSDGSDWFVM